LTWALMMETNIASNNIGKPVLKDTRHMTVSRASLGGIAIQCQTYAHVSENTSEHITCLSLIGTLHTKERAAAGVAGRVASCPWLWREYTMRYRYSLSLWGSPEGLLRSLTGRIRCQPNPSWVHARSKIKSMHPGYSRGILIPSFGALQPSWGHLGTKPS